MRKPPRTRLLRPLAALVLTACGPKVPPAPAITMAPAAIDREALPDITVRGMVVATTRMSRHLAAHGGPKTEERGPVWVYTVEYPTGELLLIDAAYPKRTAVDTADYPGKLPAKLLDLEMGRPAEAAIREDLGRTGVDAVLLTHLHDDHASGVEDFPDATLWCDRDDWSFADRKRPLRAIDPEPYENHTFRHPTYSHGPWGPFEKHTDLRGDGSVLLFPAPGHTPGSMLVLVNAREKSFLFLGDAAWTDDTWKDEARPKGFVPRALIETDWKQGMDVLHRVRTLIGRDDIAIVSGHEPANIERFPTWPEPWAGPKAATDSPSDP